MEMSGKAFGPSCSSQSTGLVLGQRSLELGQRLSKWVYGERDTAGSGSDTGVTRLRPGVPGPGECQPPASQHTCGQWCTGAGRLWRDPGLARRSTCSAWTHLAAGGGGGRGNSRVVTLPPFKSPHWHRVSLAPGPFSPHICRLTLSHPEPTSNTRHRGNTGAQASCYVKCSPMRSLLYIIV